MHQAYHLFYNLFCNWKTHMILLFHDSSWKLALCRKSLCVLHPESSKQDITQGSGRMVWIEFTLIEVKEAQALEICLQVTPAAVFDLHAWHKLHASPGMTLPSPAWHDPSLMTILLDSTAGTQREERTQTAGWCENKPHQKCVPGISDPSQTSKCQRMKLKNSWKFRRHFQLGVCLVFTQQINSNTEISTNKFKCIISIPEKMQCFPAWGLKLDLLKSR